MASFLKNLVGKGSYETQVYTKSLQGKSIALSEDGLTLVIGRYLDRNSQGAVWVFTRKSTDSDSWEQSGEKLIPKDPIGKSLYGYCIALSERGDTLVVGGPGDNDNRGAVWVYEKGPDGWIIACNQVKLVESDLSMINASYGSSVCISDNYSHHGIRICTGGPNDNSLFGGVLIFDKIGSESGSESRYQQTAKIQETIYRAMSQGESVAISGDGRKLAIGCPRNESGSVLFFNYTDKHIWEQDVEIIVGPEYIKSSKQGASISMDRMGETLAIGGPGDNGGIGATWIFKRINYRWIVRTKIICPNSIGQSLQGSSVNLTKDGTYLIIGGPGDNSNTGAVWVYKFLDGIWTYLDEKYSGSRYNNCSAVGSRVAISIGSNGNPTIAFAIAGDISASSNGNPTIPFGR